MCQLPLFFPPLDVHAPVAARRAGGDGVVHHQVLREAGQQASLADEGSLSQAGWQGQLAGHAGRRAGSAGIKDAGRQGRPGNCTSHPPPVSNRYPAQASITHPHCHARLAHVVIVELLGGLVVRHVACVCTGSR